MFEMKQCNHHKMTPDGEKWYYVEDPAGASSWMSELTFEEVSCTLEEVILFQEEE